MKVIISVPADLSCYKLVSLREILASADPSLEYEFQSDATCSRTEVKNFVDHEGQTESPDADRFSMMSSLQSALYRFESFLSGIRRSMIKPNSSLR
jgi:hypothetical protein